MLHCSKPCKAKVHNHCATCNNGYYLHGKHCKAAVSRKGLGLGWLRVVFLFSVLSLQLGGLQLHERTGPHLQILRCPARPQGAPGGVVLARPWRSLVIGISKLLRGRGDMLKKAFSAKDPWEFPNHRPIGLPHCPASAWPRQLTSMHSRPQAPALPQQNDHCGSCDGGHVMRGRRCQAGQCKWPADVCGQDAEGCM